MPIRVPGKTYKADNLRRISLNLSPPEMALLLEFPGISLTKKIEWAIRTAAELTGVGKKDEDHSKGGTDGNH